ncbi:MAG TPA: hypothetical protein VEQ59_01950 [Polyangiaceae bacterium]|nr:hypothetical protein [Polyangiaceae bacterium]
MSNGVQSNYVSDAAMLSWVSDLQNSQYGQLKASMDFETTRGEMLQDLATIKRELNEATKKPDGMIQLNDDVKAFLEKYDGVPEFQEAVDSVKAFSEATQSKADQMTGLPEAQAKWDAQPPPDAETGDTPGNRPTGPELFGKEGVKEWTDTLDAASDAANHNEQLAMIRINEIKSTIDHGAEVASQLIKSSNDTSAFAINNIA